MTVKKTNLIHYSNILENKELAPGIFRIRFENPNIAQHSAPGQFINIKVAENDPPFWRRPFSIHQIDKHNGWTDILFRVVGNGTHILSTKQTGTTLDIIGPLGNHFQTNTPPTRKALLIAGGLGIAPMLFLCHTLLEKQVKPILFYGVKTATEFCCLDDFRSADIRIYLATEDGTKGQPGFVTDPLIDFLDKSNNSPDIEMYACGPNPMLDQLSKLAESRQIPCQLSLETLMACGVGACLGCGVKSNNTELSYRYVCKEGPVFKSSEIELGE